MKQLLYTREQPIPKELAAEFQQRGFEVITIPLIATQPLPYQVSGQGFDWYFFTSSNTVRFFDLTLLSENAKVAAIGAATAKALTDQGITVDFLPQQSFAEELAAQWCAAVATSQKICWPGSQQARPVLREVLQQAGHQVTALPVYQTIFPATSRKQLQVWLQKQPQGYVLFASPSAWRHFYQIAEGQLPNRLEYAAIGPITGQAIQKDHQKVAVEPLVHDMPHLYEALLQEMDKNGI